MKNEIAIEWLRLQRDKGILWDDCSDNTQNIRKEAEKQIKEAYNMAIKALEQEPKIGYCNHCKWWKDSDGVYRRGVDAESQCPINRKEVMEGRGYCYMYEPQESKV